jgi:regulator of protease activity HflC (stomatin/prohibitin superfamily)
MSNGIKVTPFDRRAEEKNARKGKEVERLRGLFNAWRKYAKLGVFVSLCIVFILQPILKRIAGPVSAFLSHIHLPLLGTPQLGKLSSTIMFFVWILFWISLIVWYITHALKIILPWENGLITRLGTYHRTRKKGPCLTLWPFEGIEFVEVFDTRIDIAEQPVYTSDNIKVGANAILWFKTINAPAAVYNVDEIKESVYDAAYAAIRGAAAEQEIKKINAEKGKISDSVKRSFEEVTTGKVLTVPQKKRGDFKTWRGWLWFKLKDKLTLASQIEREEQGWGIKIVKVEIQDFTLPNDYEEQQRKIRVAELQVEEAENLKKVQFQKADAVAYTFQKEGEGRKALIKQQVEALKEEGAELYTAMDVAGKMSQNSKLYAAVPANVFNNLAGLFRQFTGGKTRQLEDIDR